MPQHRGNASLTSASNRSAAHNNTGSGGISMPAVGPVQRVLNYKGYTYRKDSWLNITNGWKTNEAGAQWLDITATYNRIKELLTQIDAENIFPAKVKADLKKVEKDILKLEGTYIGYSEGDKAQEDLKGIEAYLNKGSKPFLDLGIKIKAQLTKPLNLAAFEKNFLEQGYPKKKTKIVYQADSLLDKNAAKANLLNRFEATVLEVFLANDIDIQIQFIDSLPDEEINKFLQNSLDAQKKLVKGDEFQSYARLADMERNFSRDNALKYNPTSSQGAHFVKEHGSHSTLHHTITRAVEYAASKGKPSATKGNWTSYKVEHAAISWAKAMVDANLNKAHHADNSKSMQILGDIVATPANIFGKVDANVRDVLTDNYTHGETSKTGNSELVITGDYRDEANVTVNNDITGRVRGNVTGTVNGNLNNEDVEIKSITGNGLSTLDTLNATTIAANKIGGNMKGSFTFNNAQITAKVGANYIDGMGDIITRASSKILSGNTNYAPNVITGGIDGTLGDQTMGDGVKNNIDAGNVKVNGASAAINSPVNMVNAPYNWYKNGLKKTILSGPKIKNLKGNLTNPDAAGGGFTPNSLGHIIQLPKITARSSSYKKVSDNSMKQMQLLASSVVVKGTLTDLKTARKIDDATTTLADLKLDVGNVAKVNASALADINAVAVPLVGTRYKYTIGADLFEFDLQTITNPLVATDFMVLLMLKDGGMYPTYEPFTAY